MLNACPLPSLPAAPAQAVAREYAWWANCSDPFDIGGTTLTAFSLDFEATRDYAAATQVLSGGVAAGLGSCGASCALAEPPWGQTILPCRCSAETSHNPSATPTKANVRNESSTGSKANGALMRATPLAIWAHRLPAPAIAAAAAADACLSHPSQTTQDASAAYIIAVASLIRQPGDAAAALAAAEGWAAAHACGEVQQWLEVARDDAAMQQYDATHLIGFAKHAFQLAFFHLRHGTGFVEGLRHALLAGGDTGGWADGWVDACCCLTRDVSARNSPGMRQQAGMHPGARSVMPAACPALPAPPHLAQTPTPPLCVACWARCMAPPPSLPGFAPRWKRTSGQP